MRNRRPAGSARGLGLLLGATLIGGGVLATASDARAFCRTSTCPLPADWNPTSNMCVPGSTFEDLSGQTWANFDDYCAHLDPPAEVLPLWWRNECVTYDVQKADPPAAGVPDYETLVAVVDAAFAKWSATTCDGGGRVSLDCSCLPGAGHIANLGPVSCDKVEYNPDQGNQHVIIVRADWPYDSPGKVGAPISANTLGLTTVTFDANTGEIFDADTEINGSVHLSTNGSSGFDLASIVTHEMGHFLGLAHSPVATATMFARYTPGSTSMSILSDDDKEGLCAIYPPAAPGASVGTRAIGSSAGTTNIPADACDPTPRHGFSTVCAQPLDNACAAADDDGRQRLAGVVPPAIVLAGAVGALRRRRRSRRGAPPP